MPLLDIPDAGEYLWEWFFGIAGRVRRVVEGVCGPIPPSEFLAWATLTDNIVYPWEYGILTAMDVAFCDETNKELADRRALDAENARLAAAKGGKR